MCSWNARVAGMVHGRVTSSLILASCVTIAVACGTTPSDSSGAAGNSPAPGRDTCRLLTAEDIRTVMGVAPGESRFESSQCIWPSADGANEFLVQMIVTGTTVRTYDDLARKYREELNTDPATAIHPIPGAGDFAVGFNDMPMVQVYTGSTMVQVSTFGHQEQQALELAKRVVGRLD